MKDRGRTLVSHNSNSTNDQKNGQKFKDYIPDPLLVELAIERLLSRTMLDALKKCKRSIDWPYAAVHSRN